MSHILVIDDNSDLRDALRSTLQRLGHTVSEAENGVAGCKLVESAPVDVVVTDLFMPEKDGLETISELRRKNRDVKIIAMSGGGRFAGLDFLHMAQQLGAHRTLPKPFPLGEFIDALDAIITPCPPAHP